MLAMASHHNHTTNTITTHITTTTNNTPAKTDHIQYNMIELLALGPV